MIEILSVIGASALLLIGFFILRVTSRLKKLKPVFDSDIFVEHGMVRAGDIPQSNSFISCII